MVLNYDQSKITDQQEVVAALLGVVSHTSFHKNFDLNLSSREPPVANPSIYLTHPDYYYKWYWTSEIGDVIHSV